MAELTSDEPLEDIFRLVANDVRIGILRELWDAHTTAGLEEPDPDPVSFSELRDRVGIRDSGRFSYHLDELVPEFVRDHEAGYSLTYAGTRIVGAAISGVYTDIDTTFDSTPTEHCPNSECDRTMIGAYESGHMRFECESCDASVSLPAPPILVEGHETETTADVLQRFTLTKLQRTVRGFCQVCTGPLDVQVADPPMTGDENYVRVVHECRACGSQSFTTAATTVFDHPEVISFLNEAGIDYRQLAFGLPNDRLDWTESILEDDEDVAAEVEIAAEADTLEIRLNNSFEILEIEHR